MLADLTYCDFLVFAPLSIEIDALEEALRASQWIVTEVAGTTFPKVLSATLADSEIECFNRTCLIVQLNRQGILNASVDVAKALQTYDPGYIASFGIAGSFSKDAPLGSVVFGTTVIYYEPSKDKDGHVYNRAAVFNLKEDLLNIFRQQQGTIISVNGVVASGEKLFADVTSSDRKRILELNDKTLCVEMEAAGVARSAEVLRDTAQVLTIKGISDLSDEEKNAATLEQQEARRHAAAKNAAISLTDIMSKAPLRRHYQSMPRREEVDAAKQASREAESLLKTLQAAGIHCDRQQVYGCLYGRRGPVPAYYHWRQMHEHLHWIDFKILMALRKLPRHIVTPTPIVTVTPDTQSTSAWHLAVEQILGVSPITDSQLKSQQDELAIVARKVGFSSSVEDFIREELVSNTNAGRINIILNVLRFMVSQMSHKRIFVFTWRQTISRWQHLSQALGIWYAFFSWDTLRLGQAEGKSSEPGKSLQIELGSYRTLKEWAKACPNGELLVEFLDHFNIRIGNTVDVNEARKYLLRLLSEWDAELGLAEVRHDWNSA